MRSPFEIGIKPSEITPESVFVKRRTLLAAAVACGLLPSALTSAATLPADGGEFKDLRKWPDSTTEKPASFQAITTYNNFYEFGTDKSDPAANAHTLKTSPWSVQVTGEAEKPGTYTLEEILKPHALEERVYRHRCVEA
ncbi:MAG TPA: mononuclear molybdenum enzyme YedY, partial [Gammaproteobacteria bacterium]|nr:mononuclear molybdenum enzyme YedY [Gammaproteobacteria bacterium]